MRVGWKGMIFRILGAIAACGLGVAIVSGQAGPEPRTQMAEEVFKNVVVLKGIPVDEFMDTMGFFSASLSLNCSDCHTRESLADWAHYADDTPLKQTTRRMVLMVNAFNKNNFGGKRALTCYTCHRGDQRPKIIPSLAVQYGTPMEDPNEVFDTPGQVPDADAPSVDQIFNKYIQAIGGPQRVAGLTTLVGKGTYEGYDTEHEKVPVDVFVKAPAQRTMIVHMRYEGRNDDSTTTYNGRTGWVAGPDKAIPLMPLTGGNLEGLRIDTMVLFPATIKQAFSQWLVRSTTIDDRDAYIVQGTNAGKPPVKFYFDRESGLLVRVVRYGETLVGPVIAQIDFADHREVSGIKMPFRWTTTWTDGQTIVELSDLQVNAPIDDSKFARPAPAPPHR